MKRCVLVVATALLSSTVVPASGQQADPDSDLEAQLALAEAAYDIHSQIELLRRQLEKSPDDSDVRGRIAQLWLDIADYDMAESAVAEWADAPAGLKARIQAAVARRRDDDPDKAISILESYLQSAPEDTAALVDLTALYGQTGQWDKQIAVLDRLIALEPSAWAFMDRADAKRQTGKFREAVADARAAQQESPENERISSRAVTFDRLEEALDRIDELDGQLESDPKDLTALLLRAHAWQYADLPDRSLADATAALEINETSAYGQFLEGRALHALGKFDATEVRNDYFILPDAPVEPFDSAAGLVDNDVLLAAEPENATLLGYRASWFNYIGQYLLGRRDADAALAIDPVQPDAVQAAIVAETNLGNSDGALARFRALQAANPPPAVLAMAADQIAQMQFRQGNLDLTIEFADLGLAAQETESLLRYKGMALNGLGRRSEGQPLIERADRLANGGQ